MRRGYSTNSGKFLGIRSCSEDLPGRDAETSYYLEQTEVLTALVKLKGSTVKERLLLMTATLALEYVFLILV